MSVKKTVTEYLNNKCLEKYGFSKIKLEVLTDYTYVEQPLGYIYSETYNRLFKQINEKNTFMVFINLSLAPIYIVKIKNKIINSYPFL